MTDNIDRALRQGDAESCLETENEEQQARKSHDGIEACREKLRKDSGAIKILERLSGRGPKLVDDAVEILARPQATRDSKVYQLFLHDILRHAGPGMVVLCAASLGKQRVVHLAEDDRIGIVSYVKENRANLHCPSLELLAEEYRVPFMNGLYDTVLLTLRRLTCSGSSASPECGGRIQKTYP